QDLAQPPLHAVATHDGLTIAGDDNADARMCNGGSGVEDVQMGRPAPLPPTKNRLDVGASRQPSLARQPLSAATGRAHRSAGYFLPIVTTRRLRPLRRRLLRIFRPAFVAIRARNPCLFLRLRLCGRYVGMPMVHLEQTGCRGGSRRRKTCPAKT